MIITSAAAQTLTPVVAGGSGPGWATWVVGIVLIAIGVAGWYYGIHKRGKDAEAGAKIESVATGIADQLIDLLHKAHDTIGKQAAVIASPAVQAVINTPPAATPAGPPQWLPANPGAEVAAMLAAGNTPEVVAAVISGKPGYEAFTLEHIRTMQAQP